MGWALCPYMCVQSPWKQVSLPVRLLTSSRSTAQCTCCMQHCSSSTRLLTTTTTNACMEVEPLSRRSTPPVAHRPGGTGGRQSPRSIRGDSPPANDSESAMSFAAAALPSRRAQLALTAAPSRWCLSLFWPRSVPLLRLRPKCNTREAEEARIRSDPSLARSPSHIQSLARECRNTPPFLRRIASRSLVRRRCSEAGPVDFLFVVVFVYGLATPHSYAAFVFEAGQTLPAAQTGQLLHAFPEALSHAVQGLCLRSCRPRRSSSWSSSPRATPHTRRECTNHRAAE